MADQGDGRFVPVEAAETVWVAGRVRLRPGDVGLARRVRLTGAFLPLTPLLTAAGWRMQTDLVSPQATLGGLRGPSQLTGAAVTLIGVQGALDDGRGPFLLSLETNAGLYHAIASAAIAEGDVLRVTVDPHSLRHTDERARP